MDMKRLILTPAEKAIKPNITPPPDPMCENNDMDPLVRGDRTPSIRKLTLDDIKKLVRKDSKK